jgi:hypothetical protein
VTDSGVLVIGNKTPMQDALCKVAAFLVDFYTTGFRLQGVSNLFHSDTGTGARIKYPNQTFTLSFQVACY